MPISHAFVCALPDNGADAAAGKVVTSNWNADHVVTGLLPGFNVTDYGAVCDGTTDDSTAVQDAIDAAVSAGGGVVFFPAMTRVDSQIVIPNDSDSPAPSQVPLVFRGNGAHFKGISSAVYGGGGLDLRYAGTVGKLVTYGLGLLVFEDMTFINGGTDSLPFVYSTNTTLHVSRCGFVGTSSATKNDAIVLGGQGASVTGDSTGYFQGYGTVVERNYFDQINRGVLLQRNANGVVVRDNIWWSTCSGSAAIEDWNSSSNSIQGLYTSGNLIEMNNYTYGICMNYAARGVHVGDMFYDASGTFTSYYRFGNAAAIPSAVIPGFFAQATLAKLGSGSGYPGYLRQGTEVGKLEIIDNVGTFSNSALKTGRLELFGNRLVSRSPNNDECCNLYSDNSHNVKLQAMQSDGFLIIADYLGNAVWKLNANDGTIAVYNSKASTGYTYVETKGGAGQSTIPLGRYKNSSGTTGTTINADGSFTFAIATTFSDGSIIGGGNGTYVKVPSMTVGNLAAAGTAGAGARAFVTDATATTFLSVVAGGGANAVPVVSDGTNWLIG